MDSSEPKISSRDDLCSFCKDQDKEVMVWYVGVDGSLWNVVSQLQDTN